MASIVSHKGKAASVETISGTLGLNVVGPPKNLTLYNGDVQGVYTLTSASTYRWVYDEARSAGSGPRTAYAAK